VIMNGALAARIAFVIFCSIDLISKFGRNLATCRFILLKQIKPLFLQSGTRRSDCIINHVAAPRITDGNCNCMSASLQRTNNWSRKLGDCQDRWPIVAMFKHSRLLISQRCASDAIFRRLPRESPLVEQFLAFAWDVTLNAKAIVTSLREFSASILMVAETISDIMVVFFCGFQGLIPVSRRVQPKLSPCPNHHRKKNARQNANHDDRNPLVHTFAFRKFLGSIRIGSKCKRVSHPSNQLQPYPTSNCRRRAR
jgi:hypothetical protein